METWRVSGEGRNTRIKFLGLLSLSLIFLLGASTAKGERAQKSYRLGILYYDFEGSAYNPVLNGLLAGLQDRGFVEGKNLVLDISRSQAVDELRAAARRFAEGKVDVIVTVGGTETAIAKATTQEIPIVFLPAEDAQAAGFVKSLARPDRNLTGVTLDTGLAMEAKRLEVFKEVIPKLQRATLLYDAREENPMRGLHVPVLHQAAAQLGIRLSERPVKSMGEGEAAIASLSKDTTDGIFIVCSSLFNNLRKFGPIAREKGIPLCACSALHVSEQEGLLAYTPDLYSLGYRGARYVERIVNGARLSALPVETPARYELVINLNVAEAIGISIPPEILILADKVIH